VKITESKGVEVVRKGISDISVQLSTQQQGSGSATLLTDVLKVLVDDSKNVVSQNPKGNKEDNGIVANVVVKTSPIPATQKNKEDNGIDTNQNNQQRQIFANAANTRNAVNVADGIILEKNAVQGKTEKVSNNRNITQNTTQIDSSDAVKVSTRVNATKTASSEIKSSNVKSDVAVIQSDNILKGANSLGNPSNVQNENARSSKGATVILDENSKVDIKTVRKTGNDVVQVHVSDDSEDNNGKGVNVRNAKVVYVGNASNADDSTNVNKYNIQNIDDEVVIEANSRDGNQILDLLSNFSKFTNESQAILLIPTLLSKVGNYNSIGSNANGIMSTNGITIGTSKNSDGSVGSGVATVISNPILRVETKIGVSAQR